MAAILSTDVLQDDIAVSLARVVAAANKKAVELGVDVQHSTIHVAQHTRNGIPLWRVNYGPGEYIGKRGGDLIIEVNPSDASIDRVLWGQ
jgi:hypothetical protein